MSHAPAPRPTVFRAKASRPAPSGSGAPRTKAHRSSGAVRSCRPIARRILRTCRRVLCMRTSLAVLARAGVRGAGLIDGSVGDGRTPPAVGRRTRETEWGWGRGRGPAIVLGRGGVRRDATVLRRGHRTAWGRGRPSLCPTLSRVERGGRRGWRTPPRDLPAFETAVGRAMLDPSAASRCRKRVSLVGDRSESSARSSRPGPGQGWDPQLSWQETLEKPVNASSIREQPFGWKPFTAGLPGSFTFLRQNPNHPGCGARYFHHRPSVRTRRSQRSSSRLARARRVS